MDSLRNATLEARNGDPSGLRGLLAPLWDDLYLLVPIYQVAVFALTRFGPWAEEKTKDKAYVARGNWFWKPVMVLYNISMTVFSAYISLTTLWLVFDKYGGKWQSPQCSLISKDPLFQQVVYWFYISKFVEFADTLFLIVKGKGVSMLHYFHHCGAAINLGLLHKSNMEAAWLFLAFNGAIHTLMYFYYGCALVGIRLPGKNYLTSMQIAQFWSGLYFFYGYKDVKCFAENPHFMFTFFYTFAYVGIVNLFFIHFYVQSYVMVSSSSGKHKAD